MRAIGDPTSRMRKDLRVAVPEILFSRGAIGGTVEAIVEPRLSDGFPKNGQGAIGGRKATDLLLIVAKALADLIQSKPIAKQHLIQKHFVEMIS